MPIVEYAFWDFDFNLLNFMAYYASFFDGTIVAKKLPRQSFKFGCKKTKKEDKNVNETQGATCKGNDFR